MTRDEAKELAVLKTQFEELMRREAARQEREEIRDKKLDEIYDMLRWIRTFWKVTKWLGMVGGGIYIAVKHGDLSELARAFGK